MFRALLLAGSIGQQTFEVVILEEKDWFAALVVAPVLCVAGNLLGKAMDWLWNRKS